MQTSDRFPDKTISVAVGQEVSVKDKNSAPRSSRSRPFQSAPDFAYGVNLCLYRFRYRCWRTDASGRKGPWY